MQVQLIISLLLCALCHKNQPVQFNNTRFPFVYMRFYMPLTNSTHPF